VFHSPQLPHVLKYLPSPSHNLYLSVSHCRSRAICHTILCDRWTSMCKRR
jgi:hypothetical protein